MGQASEQGIRGGAVVAGLVVDVVATVGLVVAIGGAAEGASAREAHRLEVVSTFLGFACTALGGFVAAWVAGRDQVRHGAVVGAAGALLAGGLAFFAYQAELASGAAPQASPAVMLLSVLGTLPAGCLGGYLRKLQLE